jgi:hypothetical protein
MREVMEAANWHCHTTFTDIQGSHFYWTIKFPDFSLIHDDFPELFYVQRSRA